MNYLKPGPCVVCGLRDYPPSMGGPHICPTCDTGASGPMLVEAQRRAIERLERELAEAKQLLREGGG